MAKDINEEIILDEKNIDVGEKSNANDEKAANSSTQNNTLDKNATQELEPLLKDALNAMKEKSGGGKKPQKNIFSRIWDAFKSLCGFGDEETEQEEAQDKNVIDLLSALLEAILGFNKSKESVEVSSANIQEIEGFVDQLESLGEQQEPGTDIESILGDVLKELAGVKQELSDLKESMEKDIPELEPELEVTPEIEPEKENPEQENSEQENDGLPEVEAEVTEEKCPIQEAVSEAANAISGADGKGVFDTTNEKVNSSSIEASEEHTNKANSVMR